MACTKFFLVALFVVVGALQLMETEATECTELGHSYGSSSLCDEQCGRFCSLQNCAKKACNKGDCSCKRK
nr:unnamed protein product [Callosobruchus analis]CAI5867758.1 unnamed protein product [Callosobruchus analis]